MPAYIVANVEVLHPTEYREYVERNTAVVARYGGRFIARGGASEILEGEISGGRLVIIEFPSLEAARSWYHSDEYKEIAPIRQAHAATHILAVVDGVAT